MQLIKILFIILLAGSVLGADAVINTYNVGSGSAGLGAPRHHLCASGTAGEFYYYRTYYGPTRASLLLFQNYGATLVDSLLPSAGGPNSSSSDHSHVINRNDTLWITDNEYESMPTPIYTDLRVYRYTGFNDDLTYLDSAVIDTAGFDQMVAAPALIADTLFLIVRSSGSESNLSVVWAKGVYPNLTWQGDLYAFNSVNTRIGTCTNGDSVFVAAWYATGSPGYGDLYAFLYHEGAWDTVGAVLDNTQYLSREMSLIVGREGELRILTSDTTATSNIFCFWLHPDSASWVKETVHTSDKKEEDGATNRGMRHILAYTHYDGGLRCVYSSSTGEDNALDRKIYSTKYDYTTHAWGTPLSLSAVDSVKEITGVEYVPESHGSTIYVYFNYTNGSSEGHNIVTVQDASADMLLSASESAANVIIYPDEYPFMLSDADHTAEYLAGTKTMDTVRFAGDSINVDSGVLIFDRTNDWFIDGESDKIVWGKDSTAGKNLACIGWSSTTANDSAITIHKGRWLHRPENFWGDSANGRCTYRPWRHGDTLNYGARFLSLYSAGSYGLKKVILDSIYADISGAGSVMYDTVLGVPRAYEYDNYVVTGRRTERFLIRACTLLCLSSGFSDRSGFYAGAVGHGMYNDTSFIDIAQPGDTDYYNVKIENSYIYSHGQTALYYGSPVSGGGGIIKIEGTTFVGDIRNYLDTVGASGYYSTTNSYLVWLQGINAGTEMKACSLLADSNYKGARGLTIYTPALDTGWILIDSNYANCHDGFSTQYPNESHSAVIKIRDGVTRLRIFDNELWLVVDTFDASNSDGWLYDGDTVAYLNSGSIITLQANTFNDPAFSSYNSPLPWHVKIYNNSGGIIYRSNNTTGEYRNTSIYAFDNQLMNDTTTEIYGNKWDYINSFATYGHPGFDGSGSFCRIYNDTLTKIDTTAEGTTITNSADTLIVMNNYGDSAKGNILRDIYWTAGGSTGIENGVTTLPYGGTNDKCDITWEKTLSILVTDAYSNPLSGAVVTVTDNFGHLQVNTTTNGSGIATGVVKYLFLASPEVVDTVYSPFTIEASYGGGTDVHSGFNTDWQTYSDTLTIGEATPTQYQIILKGGYIRGGVFK